ncbi:MAG TPA: four helix bundle protein [Patescibacteria group bacterium]
MHQKSEIAGRTYDFALNVVLITTKLPSNPANQVMIRQVIRSATSIGANIEEALGGHTKNDFTYGMNVAKKEARETRYWLRLLADLNSNYRQKIEKLLKENKEIINILTKIVKTSAGK